MHEILVQLVAGNLLPAAVLSVPCIIADAITGTAFWQTTTERVPTMSTLNASDRFDVFPADDDDMAALAELAAIGGDFHGIRILSDAELAELAERDDYDTPDDSDIADYLADVYGAVYWNGIEQPDEMHYDAETGISYY